MEGGAESSFLHRAKAYLYGLRRRPLRASLSGHQEQSHREIIAEEHKYTRGIQSQTVENKKANAGISRQRGDKPQPTKSTIKIARTERPTRVSNQIAEDEPRTNTETLAT